MKKALIFLILLGSLITIYWREFYPISRLSKNLKDVSVVVNIDNNSYRVVQGKIEGQTDYKTKLKILNLAAFYQWTKEDPLFDSPNFDIEELGKAVPALENKQRGFLQVTGKDEYSLYPTEMLTSLINTVNLQRQFMSAPSDSLAEKLIRSQLDTASLYSTSANALNSVPLPSSQGSIMGLYTELSPEVAWDDLKKIANNGVILNVEIRKREECLKEGMGCIRPYTKFLKPIQSNFNPSEIPNLLEKQLIFKAFINRHGSFSIVGPFRTNTPCFGWKDDLPSPEHYFYVGFMPPSVKSANLPVINVLLATDLFFRKISNDPAQAYKIFYDQGHEYTPQPSSHDYICPATGYQNEIGEVEYMLKNKSPIFKSLNFKNSDVLNKAIEAEENFFQTKYPSFKELDHLGDYYGYFYRKLVETGDEDPLKEELLARYLNTKSKLAYYPLFISHQTYILDRITKFTQSDPYAVKRVMEDRAAFPFRSNYNLMYFTFSQAFWKSTDSLRFIGEKRVINSISPEGLRISYTQAQKIYNQDQIDSWFDDLNPILDQLLKNK